MSARARRHIRNPLKPPTFVGPNNLDVHMISATYIATAKVRVTMSAPIQGGISSGSFFFVDNNNQLEINGNVDVISGGPFTTFDVDFSTEDPTGNVLSNTGYIVNYIDPDYAIGEGVKLRSPDVIFWGGH